ncbi:DNA-binding CsgD family transcriptional regulator [Nocardioides salarius]|uniref:DNA-binding CsgD family transcriptional regulator n=1 Tax=Nocardioides salarius TaxID=374513 RepID=A0ABS2M5K8_9ACTN|nr:helix-turn-helix transcriptional regulator [Nocardioides salarius]MBM7506450.1 DNA-binding CsgD family transcriptional regulator [Nocardioides salarius]
MADLVLRPDEQSALGVLAAAEPVPGDPMPSRAALEALAVLVPADLLGVDLVDVRGRLVACRHVGGGWAPPRALEETGGEDGPPYLGLMHWSQHPQAAAACEAMPGTDAVSIGFRVGSDHVSQVSLDRRQRTFSERDLGVLRLVSPMLQRLLRERPTPRLPASVTVQERRVLMHVATGASNAEIAQAMFIAPSTVRKHLEHVYAKLGVHTRLEALAVLRGSDEPDLDLLERVQRYA